MASAGQNAEPTLEVSAEQSRVFKEACYMRSYRLKPEILVVEDQAFTASLLHGILTPQYKVHTAADALAAWDLYLESAPDIVFLDIEMPGMDGHSLAASLFGLDAGAFIVMVTGNHFAEDVLRARQNGVQGFIAKPFNKQKILGAVQKFIQQKKTQP